jgi:H/ACA ribonucleoprotein complex subunit 4
MKIDIEKIKEKKTTAELLSFGLINLDKCSGPTSYQVSDFVRAKLKVNKTSHFGTLDPKVTGVLPIALSRACKLTGYFLGEDKEYVGLMHIHEEVSLEEVKKAIEENFLGKITQLPPVRSSVKRAEREREIKEFEILEQDGKDFLFRVTCQGGTYIRKLISDLGDNLKVGAHMLELRRIRAGIFNEEDKEYPSVNMYDFEKAVEEYESGNEESLRKIIIPAEIVSRVYPAVKIKKSELKRIFTGKPIGYLDLIGKEKFEKGKIISVFCEEVFVGMYKVINGEDIFAKGEFVLQPIID